MDHIVGVDENNIEMQPLTSELREVELNEDKGHTKLVSDDHKSGKFNKKLKVMKTTQFLIIMKSFVLLVISLSALLIGCATFTRLLRSEDNIANYTDMINNISTVVESLEGRPLGFYLTNCISFITNTTQFIAKNTDNGTSIRFDNTSQLVWRGETYIKNLSKIVIDETGAYLVTWNINFGGNSSKDGIASVSLTLPEENQVIIEDIGLAYIRVSNNFNKSSATISGSIVLQLSRGWMISFVIKNTESVFVEQRIITFLYLG